MRTFLLMLGSALGGVVIFVAVVYGYFWYQWSQVEPGRPVSFPPRSERSVSAAPPINEVARFHGTTGSYSGDFSPSARASVLVAGPGRLTGAVASSGKPLQGLRLRLALNGSVMSQWGTSAADGQYEIALPYGTYRVDGYELDSDVVHRVLSGKIEGPREHHHGQESVVVAEGKPGKAIDFAFVDPVRKKGPRGEVPVAQPVIFTWEPYPGASAYRLQIVEQKDPADYETHKYLFDWRQQPVTEATSLNFAEQGVTLKKGYSYTVEIHALDGNKRPLSRSARDFRRADFRIAD